MTARCPDQYELLLDALGDTATNAVIGRHAAACNKCGADVRELRATIDALRTARSSATGGSCLDDEWIAALADGSLSPRDSAAAPQIGHLAQCAQCAARLAAVVRLLGDAGVAAEVARLDRGRDRRAVTNLGWTAGGLIAAASVFLLLGPVTRQGDTGGVYREASVTDANPPMPIAPIGRVATIDSLRWSSVPRARQYRLTVFRTDGAVTWDTLTVDTVVALPSAAAVRGTTYLWRVEARVGWEDRWLASRLTEFTFRASP